MIYLALGRRQLGKTTLAYSMALKCPARVILDPRALIHSSGVRVHSTQTLDFAIDQLADGTIAEILVTPDENVQALFDHTAQHVKRWAQDFQHQSRTSRRLMLLVDEARFFDLRASSAFEYVLRAAPPDLVNVMITAHRPADIPTDIRAISDHWLLFRCTQEHDLKVIGDRCGEHVREKVSRLLPHQFIDWDDATATSHVYTNPLRWYVPLRSKNAPSSEESEILPDPDPIVVDKTRLFD
jgi:hypothetical protein